MGARAIVHLCYCVPTPRRKCPNSALCHAEKQPIAPQGGMTGLVSRCSVGREIALSLERMKSVIEVDPVTATMTVEAGVELQTIQEQAEAHGLLFPLDLGARGSCTIGGNSTNAGGNRVIRYGMTRDLVIGVEAVLRTAPSLTTCTSPRKTIQGMTSSSCSSAARGRWA